MAMFIRLDVDNSVIEKTPSLADKLVEVCPVKIFKLASQANAVEVVVAVFALAAESEQATEDVGAPALGRFLQVMVGAAPPDPHELYRQMRDRGTGVFGSAEHVSKQIERYAAIGVEHLALISRFGGMDADAAEQSLRHMAPPT